MIEELYVEKLPDCCMNCVCCHTEYNGANYCYACNNSKPCISGDIYAKGRLKYCPLQSLHDHDKELVEKVLESVKNEAYKDGFCDEDGNKIITYHINNYILDQIQKEFENGKYR